MSRACTAESQARARAIRWASSADLSAGMYAASARTANAVVVIGLYDCGGRASIVDQLPSSSWCDANVSAAAMEAALPGVRTTSAVESSVPSSVPGSICW